jgi:hypothetical protein
MVIMDKSLSRRKFFKLAAGAAALAAGGPVATVPVLATPLSLEERYLFALMQVVDHSLLPCVSDASDEELTFDPRSLE